MAGCFAVAGGCWEAGPLADHYPHDFWVNGHGVSGGDGGAAVGGAAPAAAEETGQTGKGDPLLQQAPEFTDRKVWKGRHNFTQPRVADDVVHVRHTASCAIVVKAVHWFR